MNTNFFTRIAEINFSGDLQIILKRGQGGQWTVSVLLKNEQCGDNAQELIPPLLFKGTAEDLDEGFFPSLAEPIEQTSSLLLNMEAYLLQREEAKKQSAMEKEKTDREKKEQESREKKFQEAMKKVEELEKEGKYKEAWTRLPSSGDFPQCEEIIKKRKDELAKRFAPALFD